MSNLYEQVLRILFVHISTSVPFEVSFQLILQPSVVSPQTAMITHLVDLNKDEVVVI